MALDYSLKEVRQPSFIILGFQWKRNPLLGVERGVDEDDCALICLVR
jgi:hypothetical protein